MSFRKEFSLLSSQVLPIKALHGTEVDRLLYGLALCTFLLLLSLSWAAHLLSANGLTVMLGAAAIWLCIRRPEISFALFLNAGMFKGDPRLAGIEGYVDLTILFFLASLAGILRGIWKKEIQLPRPPRRLVLPFVVLLVLASVSLAYTQAPLYGREKLLRLLTLTAFAFAGPWLCFQRGSRLKSFFVTFIVISSMMVVQVLVGGNLQPDETAFQEAFGSGYLGLGSTAAQGTLIAFFYFFLLSKSRLAHWCWGGVALLNAFGALASGARGSAIALGTIGVISLVYAVREIRKGIETSPARRAVAWRIVAALSAIMGVAGGLFIALQSYLYTLYVRMDILWNYLDTQQAERIDLYQKSFALILSVPKGLLGLGIGGWTTYYYGFDAPRGGFPHNVFLEVGAEIGWMGLLSLGLLFYWAMKTGSGLWRETDPERSLVGLCFKMLLIYMLIYSCFHGDLNDFRNWFTWMCAVYACQQFLPKKGAISHAVAR